MRSHTASPAWHWPAPRAALWFAGAALVLLAAVALERTLPRAALWALFAVVGGLGTVHGVLDTVLVTRLLPAGWARGRALLAYLAVTLLIGWLLLAHPALALMVLLSLSLWHFGESFQTPAASPWEGLCQRLLRGGVPVLMPALVSQTELAPLAQAVAAGDNAALAMLWGFWTGLAWLWAVACGAWLLGCVAAAGDGWRAGRALLTEVAALAALNLLCSPLMAFALYFGLYHAAGHIGRVWATQEAPRRAQLAADWRVWLTLLLSLALIAGLFSGASASALSSAWPDAALRLLIIGLVAVSVPHVVLISCWARLLRNERKERAQTAPHQAASAHPPTTGVA
jgi:beta-carotene 15,15'-dioxygenase